MARLQLTGAMDLPIPPLILLPLGALDDPVGLGSLVTVGSIDDEVPF